jgi:hypothetical protein
MADLKRSAIVNINTLARALAKRTEVILSQQDHPKQAMKEIEDAAYSAWLVTETVHLPWSSPAEFADDLWIHNPAAAPWLNLKRENIRNPLTISELPDLIDAIGT